MGIKKAKRVKIVDLREGDNCWWNYQKREEIQNNHQWSSMEDLSWWSEEDDEKKKGRICPELQGTSLIMISRQHTPPTRL